MYVAAFAGAGVLFAVSDVEAEADDEEDYILPESQKPG